MLRELVGSAWQPDRVLNVFFSWSLRTIQDSNEKLYVWIMAKIFRFNLFNKGLLLYLWFSVQHFIMWAVREKGVAVAALIDMAIA
jgi:hypothetical protein